MFGLKTYNNLDGDSDRADCPVSQEFERKGKLPKGIYRHELTVGL